MKGHNHGPDMEEDFEADGDEATQKEYEKLAGMSLEDILKAGQIALYGRLVAKATAGTASHQELAILRNVLKDNGLTLGIPPEVKPEGNALDLPTFEDPEE